MVSDKDIQEGFLGKPYTVTLKDDNKKGHEFEFQQLETPEIPLFLEMYNILKNNGDKWCIEASEIASELIKKMMDMSYPDWQQDNRKNFIKINYLLLRDVLIQANTITLTNSIFNQKSDEELKQFVEQERAKQDGKSSNTTETEQS